MTSLKTAINKLSCLKANPIKRGAQLTLVAITLLANSAPATAGFDFGPFDWFDSNNDNRYSYPQSDTYYDGRGGYDRWRDYEMWEPNYWRYRLFDNNDDWGNPSSWGPMSGNRFSPGFPGDFPSSFPGNFPNGFPGNSSNNGRNYGPSNSTGYRSGYGPRDGSRYNNSDDWFDDMPFFGSGNNDWFDDMPFFGSGNNNSFNDGNGRFNFDFDMGFDGQTGNNWKNDWRGRSQNYGYSGKPQNQGSYDRRYNQNARNPSTSQSRQQVSPQRAPRNYRNDNIPAYPRTNVSQSPQQIPQQAPVSPQSQSQQPYNSRYNGGIGGYDDRYDDDYWRNYSNQFSTGSSGRNQSQQYQPNSRGQRMPSSPYTR